MALPAWLHPANADFHVYPDENGDITEEVVQNVQARIERGQLVVVHTHSIQLNPADMWEMCDDGCELYCDPNIPGLPEQEPD